MSLEIDRIEKWLGGVCVLAEVSMHVPEDGLTGLIGPNGAGKSTLFAVVSGFEPADGGSVRFAGHALDGLAPAPRAQLGLMRTFQVPRPFSRLSVRDNLAAAAPKQIGETLRGAFFGGARSRAEQAAIRARAEEVMAFLNLATVADSPARALSGGQRKLLELGRVLMGEPRMILLDEPFAGVNPVLQAEIAERILALNARGIGFLVVEHNLAALTRMVRHMYVMDRGRIIAEGAPESVLDQPAVHEAYTGGVL